MLTGVSGIFAMNLLHSEALQTNLRSFKEVSIVSSAGTYLVLGALITYYVWKGVMRFAP